MIEKPYFQYGMKWERFERHVKHNLIRYATSRDKDLRSAAKLTEEHGIEAGCCWLAALEFARVNGANASFRTAMGMYKRVAEKHNDTDLKIDLSNLEFGLSWLGYSGPKEIVWPVKYPFKKLCKHVGLLHFMLHLGLREAAETTCGFVALAAWKTFMERKRGATNKAV